MKDGQLKGFERLAARCGSFEVIRRDYHNSESNYIVRVWLNGYCMSASGATLDSALTSVLEEVKNFILSELPK